MNIRGYVARFRKLGDNVQEYWATTLRFAHYIRAGVYKGRMPRTYNNRDLLRDFPILGEIRAEIRGALVEIDREFQRDLCQTRTAVGSDP